jgi:toxin ParE1/3/4
MTLCKFANSAKRDLREIAEYSEKLWGKSQTLDYLDSIKSRVIALANNPKIGIPQDAIYPHLLSFPIKKHVVYYLQQDDGIAIVRILHEHMYPKIHQFPKINN